MIITKYKIQITAHRIIIIYYDINKYSLLLALTNIPYFNHYIDEYILLQSSVSYSCSDSESDSE